MPQGGELKMRIPFTWRVAALTAVALSTAGLAMTAPMASARPPRTPQRPHTLFVNGSMLSGYARNPCSSTPYTTIGAAVTAAAPGGHIVVCAGTYREDVTVTKPLTIRGIDATVDATGQINGFTLPAPAAGTTVEGFTIENAIGEGVLAVSTSHVSILDNVIENNDKGLTQPNTYEQC